MLGISAGLGSSLGLGSLCPGCVQLQVGALQAGLQASTLLARPLQILVSGRQLLQAGRVLLIQSLLIGFQLRCESNLCSREEQQTL